MSQQLQASLRGEKDWHDQVVDAYEQQIKDRYNDQQAKLKDMLETHKEDFGDRNVVGSTSLQGLTPGEVQDRITRRKQLDAQQTAQRVLYPQLEEKAESVHKKWGLANPEVDTSFSQTDRDPSQAIPITRPVTSGKPFRRS